MWGSGGGFELFPKRVTCGSSLVSRLLLKKEVAFQTLVSSMIELLSWCLLTIGDDFSSIDFQIVASPPSEPANSSQNWGESRNYIHIICVFVYMWLFCASGAHRIFHPSGPHTQPLLIVTRSLGVHRSEWTGLWSVSLSLSPPLIGGAPSVGKREIRWSGGFPGEDPERKGRTWIKVMQLNDLKRKQGLESSQGAEGT